MKSKKSPDKEIHVRKKVAGGTTGAVLGAVVGGPMGALVGGVLGTVVGGAAESGELAKFSARSRVAKKVKQTVKSKAKKVERTIRRGTKPIVRKARAMKPGKKSARK